VLSWRIGNNRLEIVQGDITEQDTDVIVNAANSRLAPGGGVCGAIHRAAGPELAEACAKIGGCPTGEVRVTPGFNLKAKYVFHAVGPVYKGLPEDAELLASCYRESLKKLVELGLTTISFPAISTGIYGYPVREAAQVALSAIADFLQNCSAGLTARMVLFSRPDYEIHREVLMQLMEK